VQYHDQRGCLGGSFAAWLWMTNGSKVTFRPKPQSHHHFVTAASPGAGWYLHVSTPADVVDLGWTSNSGTSGETICMAWQEEAAHTHTLNMSQYHSVSTAVYMLEVRASNTSQPPSLPRNSWALSSQHLLAPWNMATPANTTRRKSILVTEAHGKFMMIYSHQSSSVIIFISITIVCDLQ
jgi:hypothetical protein